MQFSIVIPSLNQSRHLGRSLDSVLGQIDGHDEVLVVDGGSRDGSREIIQGHSSRLAWWVSEPDAGQSAALNKGFAHARNEFLLWVNADDILLPGALAAARDYLQVHPECRWLAGNLIYLDEDDRVLWCARDGSYHDWLFRHAPVRVYGPTSIFSRKLFERVGGFDESLHYVMDTDLWLRFKAAGARFERLHRYCWAFRMHGGSKTAGDLTGHTDPRMAEEQRRMCAKNGLVVKRSAVWQQRLWRVANGCYARAWWDTRRWKGKRIGCLGGGR